MSVEDEEPDFLSDEADDDDDEAERDDGDRDGDHMTQYAELLMLYHRMMWFDHIHFNSVIMDMLNEDENENDPEFLHNWVDDMMSAFGSVMSPEDWSTSDSDDVGLLYAPFSEDTFSSSDSGADADRWPPWTPNWAGEATNFTPDGTEAGAGAEPGPEAEAEATEQ